METQTRLSRHNKLISAENITMPSVSSDDYLYASLSSQRSKHIRVWVSIKLYYIYIEYRDEESVYSTFLPFKTLHNLLEFMMELYSRNPKYEINKHNDESFTFKKE